jgi:hypothetical protein
MCGAANEDWLKIFEADFLKEQADCWTARQTPDFSVVNLHAMYLPAPTARIFLELASRDLLASGLCWRFLMGFRIGIGEMFGWGRAWPGSSLRRLGRENIVASPTSYRFTRRA